ncbi:M1 family metallopeptidase [Mucilaginibacter arboris]|uniref:M1 family peptidase n=1 Tax=Mucilaginibacter arboris TaxID=2682090 RepID=A0A7K1SWR8_9SPHI|nr:M1 family metallopeptidase [Mucilaginibacter arboris]MVN21779.1 M1 family peptidase [Mucilaginibacter arboris]
MMKQKLTFLLLIFSVTQSIAQSNRWQQRVNYTMVVNMNVQTNRFTGIQKLEYTNNSPDTLKRVFYHLYWNAFQPNSMMDMRSRELGNTIINKKQDWDARVKDRIQKLTPQEIGYQKVLSLKLNGIAQKYKTEETILVVDLDKPILPHGKVVFDMVFEAQVPLQIRRSGRDNPQTGVRYSMSQWYPKMCEYDYEGWHPTPYVAREFYGVWGDYDVKITIDKKYLIGGTGYLQNPQEIGFGYEAPGTKVTQPAGNTLTWHFIAPNVHDFMWAADPEFKHLSAQTADGKTINVIYNRDPKKLQQEFEALKPEKKQNYQNAADYIKNWDDQWQEVLHAAVTELPYIQKTFGPYPWKQYSFVHGGDGGMEYPMATLINGPGLGTVFHEWMHSWYQGMMGTNESEYPWMDEGFTSYAEDLVSRDYTQFKYKNLIAANPNDPRLKILDSVLNKQPHEDAYNSYYNLVKLGLQEPLTTHADHYETNAAYSISSYSKGEIFLEQLGYITGAQVRDQILLQYYREWRFKHPNANDFIRVAEKVSNMKLDWYKEYWINTTKTIDYGIDSVWQEGNKTKIRLINNGKMPMPIDLQITFLNGKKMLHYIPMYLMFGEKPAEPGQPLRVVEQAWKWTHPTYTLELNGKLADMWRIEIDPTKRMADVKQENNLWQVK